MSGGFGMSSNEAVIEGSIHSGWWLVDDDGDGPGRVVAGPFPDRAEAGWAAGAYADAAGEVRPVHGTRRNDGGLDRRPSSQERAWLAELGRQLERLPVGWDEGLPEDDPAITLVVELGAVLLEAGLPLHDSAGVTGGACLTPAPGLHGVVVSWRGHDRMSVEQVHGAVADDVVQQVMNRALADVLRLHGFAVDTFGAAGGHVVRWAS
ncbi:hypothetical protein GCM10010531_05280 [Blastococcus jejuensis]|uniref:Uncharacterized protein n=2 Tax=Blastococcus jejuensis TaxID=351224 RepID=A0ABP6NT28_9ACTN